MPKAKKQKEAAKKRKPPKPQLKYCPDTGDKIYIRSVTLADIKYAKRTGEQPNKKMKQLLWIPSQQMRLECLDHAARALETRENQILPTYGGRSWQVTVKLAERQTTTRKSPLFRWYRGALELAVLPHLLEKVPDPQESRGMAKLIEAEEEGFFHSSTALCERSESQLSRMAFGDTDHAIPAVSLKWMSPNNKTFSSRKSAVEHASLLVQQQLLVDKVVFGYGARGQPLRPTKPSKKDALTAGKWRFLRDGLWVVGQEESWQKERAKVVMQQDAKDEEAARTKKAIRKTAATAAATVSSLTGTSKKLPLSNNAPKKPPRVSTAVIKRPIQLFLKTQRTPFRQDKLAKLAVAEHDVTPSHFSMGDAERDLKEIWKKMSKEEKHFWKDLMDGADVVGSSKNQEDSSNDAATGHPQSLAGDCQPANKDTIMQPTNKNDAAAKKDGLQLYIRDHREHLRHQRVGQRTVQPQQEGDTPCAADCYTLDDADEDLAKMWSLLEDATRIEWQDKAAKEVALLLSEQSVVISPGESDEEAEEAASPAASDEGPEAQPSKPPLPGGENQQTGNVEVAKVIVTNSQQEKTEVSVDSSGADQTIIRKSKRARTKRNLDIQENPSPATKPRRKPSIWAFPVVAATTVSTADAADAEIEETTPTVDTNMPAIDDTIVKGKPPQGSANIATADESMTITDDTTLEEKAPEGSAYFPTAVEKVEIERKISTDSKLVEENTSKVCKPMGVKNPASKRKRSACPPKQISQSAHWRLTAEQIRVCHEAATDHFEKVMYTVQARALFAELADGFDLLRERGRGRYDMELPAFEQEEFSFLTDLQKAPWMPVVRQMLGKDVVLIHKGVFLSNPGADAQVYHQDGPHLSTQHQRPCHAVNVFVPLVDLNLRNGPTEFVAGSHMLGYDDYERSNVVTPEVAAGTPIIFDYRLGHRGLANTSNICRPIVYCTYAAVADGKVFSDSVNFSRKRYHRLGELAEKPLSRDERRKLRDIAKVDRECNEAVEEIEAATSETTSADPSTDERIDDDNAQPAASQVASANVKANTEFAKTAAAGCYSTSIN